MIGKAWWRLLCLPFIVVVAFGLFCLALVVSLIGVIDPHSTPHAELRKLAGYADAAEQWWNRPRW